MMMGVYISETAWDLSTPEFGKWFDRMSEDMDMEGCTTAIELESLLKSEIRVSKNKARDSKVGVVRAYHAYRAEQLFKALEKDFAGRAIREAVLHPQGYISLTLQYGRKDAIRMRIAQQRAKVRARRGFKIAI
jgi:hypothetical protein